MKHPQHALTTTFPLPPTPPLLPLSLLLFRKKTIKAIKNKVDFLRRKSDACLKMDERNGNEG